MFAGLTLLWADFLNKLCGSSSLEVNLCLLENVYFCQFLNIKEMTKNFVMTQYLQQQQMRGLSPPSLLTSAKYDFQFGNRDQNNETVVCEFLTLINMDGERHDIVK